MVKLITGREQRSQPAARPSCRLSDFRPPQLSYLPPPLTPADELGKLVVALSKETGATVPELMNAYGRHLFGRFHEGYPQFFAGSPDSFSFLRTIDQVVHVEVRKLYPDAELPHFETIEAGPGRLTMIYRSPRCLGDFAEGLMEGCFAHFGERMRVTRSDAAGGREVRFDLERL